eukprot:scaffold304091_cov33-Tisochrysis_lutea.AAC.5
MILCYYYVAGRAGDLVLVYNKQSQTHNGAATAAVTWTPPRKASRTWSVVRTVPAPSRSSGTAFAIAEIVSRAVGLRKTTSATRTPPEYNALAIGTASATSPTEMMGSSRVASSRLNNALGPVDGEGRAPTIL